MFKKYNFNELKRALSGINSRTLTDRLRFLEQRKIITRRILTASPVRVEYKLTNFGKEALVLIIPITPYFILPPSIKRKLPKIKIIEKKARIAYKQ